MSKFNLISYFLSLKIIFALNKLHIIFITVVVFDQFFFSFYFLFFFYKYLWGHYFEYFLVLLIEQILQAHRDEVWFLQFSHNGKYLASSSSDRLAIIWEVTLLMSYVDKKLFNYLFMYLLLFHHLSFPSTLLFPPSWPYPRTFGEIGFDYDVLYIKVGTGILMMVTPNYWDSWGLYGHLYFRTC